MSNYNYNSADLVKSIELTDREEFLLKESKTFCIYPWIHLHAYPTGEAYPCCHAEMRPGVVGNCRSVHDHDRIGIVDAFSDAHRRT